MMTPKETLWNICRNLRKELVKRPGEKVVLYTLLFKNKRGTKIPYFKIENDQRIEVSYQNIIRPLHDTHSLTAEYVCEFIPEQICEHLKMKISELRWGVFT